MGIYNFLIAMPRLESWLHWPVPAPQPLPPFARAPECHRRRHDPAPPRRDGRQPRRDRGDLLSMLIASRYETDDASITAEGMTDPQVRDEVLTIFLAGYETVANALTWTWYCLSQNPEAETTMLAELRHARDGRRSPAAHTDSARRRRPRRKAAMRLPTLADYPA